MKIKVKRINEKINAENNISIPIKYARKKERTGTYFRTQHEPLHCRNHFCTEVGSQPIWLR